MKKIKVTIPMTINYITEVEISDNEFKENNYGDGNNLKEFLIEKIEENQSIELDHQPGNIYQSNGWYSSTKENVHIEVDEDFDIEDVRVEAITD